MALLWGLTGSMYEITRSSSANITHTDKLPYKTKDQYMWFGKYRYGICAIFHTNGLQNSSKLVSVCLWVA